MLFGRCRSQLKLIVSWLDESSLKLKRLYGKWLKVLNVLSCCMSILLAVTASSELITLNSSPMLAFTSYLGLFPTHYLFRLLLQSLIASDIMKSGNVHKPPECRPSKFVHTSALSENIKKFLKGFRIGVVIGGLLCSFDLQNNIASSFKIWL